MSYTRTRSMTTALSGPTVDQMRDFIEGIPDSSKVRIDYDKGYNQFDAGSITFTVTEG